MFIESKVIGNIMNSSNPRLNSDSSGSKNKTNNGRKNSASCGISSISDDMHLHHSKLVGIIKSIEGDKMLRTNLNTRNVYEITAEGLDYADVGTPEYRLCMHIYSALNSSNSSSSSSENDREGPLTAELLKSMFSGSLVDLGLSKSLKNRWLQINKTSKSIHPNDAEFTISGSSNSSDCRKAVIVDLVQLFLRAVLTAITEYQCDEGKMNGLIDIIINNNRNLIVLSGTGKDYDTATAVLQDLKRRKLISVSKHSYYECKKTEGFSMEVKDTIADISQAMLINDTWKAKDLKPYNFFARGRKPEKGSVHPLMRVMNKFKKILISMGFEEMATNCWVESSFWNFDSLFQPQQHPARDAQDTFFLKEPYASDMSDVPEDLIMRVKRTHETGGGYGSIGYRYDWSLNESKKNILRTHTTAVSSRMLYFLAQDSKKNGFKAKRYFSIDRVFRNETLDATHLAEFHQVEGVVADRGLSLGHLIGVFKAFFSKIGITELKFKPAYNPYTEPSMEIFGFHPMLKKWIEVGNSGFFRPEMLLPMELPPDIVVIAWGLSLERPTMIKYGISNIRELFGHRATLGCTV